MADQEQSSGGLSQADYEALAAFRLELRRYFAFAQEVADTCGLTMQQHQAMLAIRASPAQALSITEIAESMFLRHHSAVELVDRLEKVGVAARSRDPKDARRAIVTLTPKGAELLASMATQHLREIQQHGPRLARTLRSVLKP